VRVISGEYISPRRRRGLGMSGLIKATIWGAALRLPADRFSGVIAAWALVLTMGAASLVIIPALHHGSGSSQLVGVHIIAGGAAPPHQVTPPCDDASAQSPAAQTQAYPARDEDDC
jgi:hypothetical protein